MRSFSSPISRITPLPEEAGLRRLGNLHAGPLVAALLLTAAGLATVASASSELGSDHLSRQAVAVGLGLVALAFVFLVDYHTLVDLSPILYLGSGGLLVLVLFIGREAKGAKSWLSLGPVGFQPSDLARFALVLLLARYLGGIRRQHLEIREIATAGLLAAVPVVLIALERDLGGALMLLPMLAGMLLVAGIRLRQILLGIALGAVVAFGLWSFAMHPYQRQRIHTFLSPESDPQGAGYQLRQSKIAVGSGQLVGRGYGQGTQSQLRFLPERHNDFIMAVLAEEWGFVGVVVVLGLYGLYVTSAVQVAQRARDRTGILLVVGLVSSFAFYVLYNTAMVIGLVPITGVPLPFLSYGGTFTLLNYAATGLVLNVDYRRYVNR